MAVLLNRSVLRPVGRARSRAWGLGRGREDGASDVRIIDIRGADEGARQPTGGKGPRITSGGPYSSRRSGQTCVHPVLSALCSRAAPKTSKNSECEAKEKTKNMNGREKKGGNETCRCERNQRDSCAFVSLPRSRERNSVPYVTLKK